MSNKVEMTFWDVQHGNATYIKTPNDRHIVIDLGVGTYSGGGYFSPLRHLREKYYVKQLDYVIVTHPHKDHIEDIMEFDTLKPKVLRRSKELTDKEIMKGVREEDREMFEKYCEICNRYNLPVEKYDINYPSNPTNWGGLSINTFHSPHCSHDNFNNHSLITILEYANIKVIIPGDNEDGSWSELFKDNDFVSAIKDCDILLASHHGRESGYNKNFVKYANPRITIVSDGKYCDSSANVRYSNASRGWIVYNKNKQASKKRYCLTTNSDGTVKVEFGRNSGGRFLKIYTF